MVHGHLLFLLVLQQKALHAALRLLGASHGDAEVALVQLTVVDLLVEDTQRLRVLGGDDDAAGVAVDAVAQRRGESVFGLRIPLTVLAQVGLNV